RCVGWILQPHGDGKIVFARARSVFPVRVGTRCGVRCRSAHEPKTCDKNGDELKSSAQDEQPRAKMAMWNHHHWTQVFRKIQRAARVFVRLSPGNGLHLNRESAQARSLNGPNP